jgi:hypothetical protein
MGVRQHDVLSWDPWRSFLLLEVPPLNCVVAPERPDSVTSLRDAAMEKLVGAKSLETAIEVQSEYMKASLPRRPRSVSSNANIADAPTTPALTDSNNSGSPWSLSH